MSPAPEQRRRIGRLETVGAWLGLWTPPREVEVPPVPWRRLALAAALLGACAVVVMAVVVPAVDRGKDEDAASRRRADDARVARRAAFVRREQRPRHGVGPADPGAAARGRRLAVRERLAGQAGAAVRQDALARFRVPATARGLAVSCRGYPPSDRARPPAERLDLPRGAYDCLVPTAQVDGGRGTIGIPYRLVVDFARGRFAFCKVNPLPSEKALPDPRVQVALPAPCRAPRTS